MLWKCCTQYDSKFGKLSSGHRTGKRSVFIQIPKKGNAKECSNYCTVAVICRLWVCTTGKTIALTRWTFVGKVMSLLFNMLSRFVIAFLPRSKCLLISWLQSSSAVIYEPPKIKSVTVSIVSTSFCHEVMGLVAMVFVYWMLSFKLNFSLSSFTFIKRLFSSSLHLGIQTHTP